MGSNLSSAGDGLKKISEIEKMSSFLVENGASRFWRASLVEKLTDIRPIVEAGKNTTVRLILVSHLGNCMKQSYIWNHTLSNIKLKCMIPFKLACGSYS